MKEFLHVVSHSLSHALVDSVKILPFLFISYLIMEMIEHYAKDKTKNAIAKAGKKGPFIASLAGAVPQCAFSAGVAGLYSGGVITLGTLISLFLSTSDEMVPVMLSMSFPARSIITLLAFKVIVALIVGLLVDFIYKRKSNIKISELCEEDGCHCEKGIFRSALHHSLEVFVFILAVNLALEVTIGLIGEDTLALISVGKGFFGCVISAVVGLIPNCASSVLLTELYLGGVISAGAMMSGLLTGAGVGTLVLFKTNKKPKENLFILLILFLSGILFGGLFDLLGVQNIL